MRTLAVVVCAGLLSTPAFAGNNTALTASVGPGFLNRNFSWDNGGGLRLTETLPFAGAMVVDVSWFPGAHVTDGVGSWFGLFGAGDFGLGLASTTESGEIFAQSSTRLRFGALVRLPMGSIAHLVLHAGYARQAFSTSSRAVNAAAPRPSRPDVAFDGPRGGVGLRLKLGSSVELDVLLGGQYVLGLGELGTAAWFPNATAFALDAGGGLSVQLAEHARLRFSGQWQRTFVTLNGGASSDTNATEQYVVGAVTLQWVM